MEILSVFDSAFKPYGKVVTGMEDTCKEILTALEKTPLPAGTDYVPSEPLLQNLPAAVQVSENLYGGMPVQLGWCNGHNTKLNCLEYHRDSEFNLGTQDFILLLAKMDDIDENGKLDTAKVKAFRVMVALPWLTNTDKPALRQLAPEDKLLWARNKWLLAHAESSEAAQGAYVGLVGENIDIADSI